MCHVCVCVHLLCYDIGDDCLVLMCMCGCFVSGGVFVCVLDCVCYGVPICNLHVCGMCCVVLCAWYVCLFVCVCVCVVLCYVMCVFGDVACLGLYVMLLCLVFVVVYVGCVLLFSVVVCVVCFVLIHVCLCLVFVVLCVWFVLLFCIKCVYDFACLMGVYVYRDFTVSSVYTWFCVW